MSAFIDTKVYTCPKSGRRRTKTNALLTKNQRKKGLGKISRSEAKAVDDQMEEIQREQIRPFLHPTFFKTTVHSEESPFGSDAASFFNSGGFGNDFDVSCEYPSTGEECDVDYVGVRSERLRDLFNEEEEEWEDEAGWESVEEPVHSEMEVEAQTQPTESANSQAGGPSRHEKEMDIQAEQWDEVIEREIRRSTEISPPSCPHCGSPRKRNMLVVSARGMLLVIVL